MEERIVSKNSIYVNLSMDTESPRLIIWRIS